MASLWGASLVLVAGCIPVDVVGGGDEPTTSDGVGGMGGGGAGGTGAGGTGAGGTGAGGTGAGGTGAGGGSSCPAFEPSADCDPLGHYTVVETGPVDGWIPDETIGPFEIVVTDDCGTPKAEGYKSKFLPATCTLQGVKEISNDCYEIDGQSFCTYVDRAFELSFASVPATGTVTLSCSGECGFMGTAPAEAVKKP
ncbi:hypothetical protein [Polyangium mundeleinium]|uniref:Lipoprotein n=1 Tax=Polyangium mundeleinium TaxID=2995306 RepID=A0ABT5EZ58_9BACT|nr:hypothetical protein [Polyangium mundeleinium]MDC0747118.1 hypothetical protein [Polyangium mundeleinium]